MWSQLCAQEWIGDWIESLDIMVNHLTIGSTLQWSPISVSRTAIIPRNGTAPLRKGQFLYCRRRYYFELGLFSRVAIPIQLKMHISVCNLKSDSYTKTKSNALRNHGHCGIPWAVCEPEDFVTRRSEC